MSAACAPLHAPAACASLLLPSACLLASLLASAWRQQQKHPADARSPITPQPPPHHPRSQADGDAPTIFDKIASKAIPADIIYEDDECLALRDIQPQVRGRREPAAAGRKRGRAARRSKRRRRAGAKAQGTQSSSRARSHRRPQPYPPPPTLPNLTHRPRLGQAPVHFLVIPKHRDGLTRLSRAEERHKAILGHLLFVAQLVARQGAQCGGWLARGLVGAWVGCVGAAAAPKPAGGVMSRWQCVAARARPPHQRARVPRTPPHPYPNPTPHSPQRASSPDSAW